VSKWCQGWNVGTLLSLCEQVTHLDPALNLVFHGPILWLEFIPCTDHLECILEFIDVMDGMLGWLFLLQKSLHSGGELCFSWLGGSPVWWHFLGDLGAGEEHIGLFGPKGSCSIES
jgi:hypothetical protein